MSYFGAVALSNFRMVLNGLNTLEAAIIDETNYQHELKIVRYFNLISRFIDICIDINKLTGNNDEKLGEIKTYLSIGKNIANGNYTSALLELTSVYQKEVSPGNEKLKKLLEVLNHQGIFIAMMAEAETSTEVEQILQMFAAPLGSWRDKRNTKFNLAFDSYIGPSILISQGEYFAVSTPVGISMTFPAIFDLSPTALFSLFDLGPLTAWRLTNDSDLPAKIYLDEIFSPGFHISIGIGKKCIFNVNGSYQRITRLQTIGGDQGKIIRDVNWGGAIGLTVNIPLFTLINNKTQ